MLVSRNMNLEMPYIYLSLYHFVSNVFTFYEVHFVLIKDLLEMLSLFDAKNSKPVCNKKNLWALN